MTEPDAPSGWIGRAVPRQDERLVTGAGRFADDFEPPGVLHCAILRSPHPHARILKVDVSKARSLPGVAVAISGAEALDHWAPLPEFFVMPGLLAPVTYSLAVDKAVYAGEPVAALAATDRYLAEDALDAIEVEYEVLEPVHPVDKEDFDWGDDDRVVPNRVHEDWQDNTQLRFDFAYGDVEARFAEADVVIDASVGVHRYGAMPLEPRVAVADFDAAERALTVRLSTQVPHLMKTAISEVFGLPEKSVRVIAGDVGGAFGAKMHTDHEFIPILLSLLAGRPVKWAETRLEWLLAGPVGSRGYRHVGQMALRSDGTVLALRDRVVADVGCDGVSRGVGAGGPIVSAIYGPGPYRIDTYEVKARAVVANTAPCAPYRGYGKDMANQFIERLMDKAAERLGIDPVEIRRRNLVDEFPYEMCSGPVIESGSSLQCLDLLCEKMDLPALRRAQADGRARGRFVGIGIVSTLEPSGAALPGSKYPGVDSATVRMHADGTVTAFTGIQSLGQGIQTSYAQVVADCLGVSMANVDVRWGDTDMVPYGGGAWSSRGSTYGIASLNEAASVVRRKLAIAAGNLLEADPADIEICDDLAWVSGIPDRSLPVATVARGAYSSPGAYAVLPGVENPQLDATATYASPVINWVPDEHWRLQLYPSHGTGALGCMVEVDIETGQVDVQKIWVAHDAGRIINPGIVEAQMIGSAIQAVGGTILEQIVYDDDCQLLTRTLGDYQLPIMASTPEVEVFHIETPSPNTKIGSKGVGEGCHIGVGAALLSAAEDALRPLGVEFLDTPLSPPGVLAAIDRAGTRPGQPPRHFDMAR